MKCARWSREAALLACWLVGIGGAACSPPATPSSIPVVNVSVTSAAYPWLEAFYSCGKSSTAIRLSDPESADIQVRLGEPSDLTLPAFQIGDADMGVVVHPQNSLKALTLPQVRQLFAGEITNWQQLGGTDQPVEIWAYSSGEDVQAYFDRTVMEGRPISSLARLAVSAQAMSEGVAAAPGAVGFLPNRWMAGDLHEVLPLPPLPVLAIARTAPSGPTKSLLSCVQSSLAGSR